MSSDTITLELDKYESGVVFHSLKDKRNQMLKEGKDTELVDDVLNESHRENRSTAGEGKARTQKP